MGVMIGRHEFEGPLATFADVPPAAGLYAVLHLMKDDLLIAEIEQTDNLLQSLTDSFVSLQNRQIVILPCLERNIRNSIFTEIVREFDFDYIGLPDGQANERFKTQLRVALSFAGSDMEPKQKQCYAVFKSCTEP